MHHKYLIVDNSDPSSDPLLLTGSHNWSSSAEYRNDENTLIVHDATIANIYYQEFTERFRHGIIIVDKPKCSNDYHTITQDSVLTVDVTENDDIPGTATLTIIQDPAHGTASTNDVNTITYDPADDFTGLDTVAYKIALTSNTALYDSALLVVYVTEATAVEKITNERISIWPNPSDGRLTVSATTPVKRIRVYTVTGTLLREIVPGYGNAVPLLLQQSEGIYLLEITTEKGKIRKKILIR